MISMGKKAKAFFFPGSHFLFPSSFFVIFTEKSGTLMCRLCTRLFRYCESGFNLFKHVV
jgi:hypothetical protein